jgi:hypothetical protein
MRNRKYAYLCFSYLKWVDDFVDNPNIDKNKKLKFVENQLRLLSSICKGEEADLNSNEEVFLYYCINYAISIDKHNVIKEGKESIESIAMDANRLFNNGIFSASELNDYGIKTVRPVFNLSYYALIPSIELPQNNKYAGRFIWFVLNLRDFFEDIDSGYINISREELKKYEIDRHNLQTKNLTVWMKDKYEEYMSVLNEDITILSYMPIKVKLFWGPIYPYMIYELIRIKVYNYEIRRKLKKNLVKEFKVFTQTFSLSVKFFLRIFI